MNHLGKRKDKRGKFPFSMKRRYANEGQKSAIQKPLNSNWNLKNPTEYFRTKDVRTSPKILCYSCERFLGKENQAKPLREIKITIDKQNITRIENQKKKEMYKLQVESLFLRQEIRNLKIKLEHIKNEKIETVRKLNMKIKALKLRVSLLCEEVIKEREYIRSIKRKNSKITEPSSLCNSYKDELKVVQMKNKELENEIDANKDAVLISPVV
ncbi:hypothetical protein NPIL_599131 [Nephila pilipes]|uniref:Uncharacterized protein n=1 Tax=Nephila pilipes TaxID=299642 RepID=A0A8X6TF77_NEPPI|nr:hypothetical protein NPIL_599131 [Nephila pilipes]